jgi:hypothetical protein
MALFPEVPCLPYPVARALIATGDILLCSGHAAFSKLIQYSTKSPWSHVAVVLWLHNLDRLVVLESVESIGTRMVPLRHYVQDYNGSGQGYHGRVYIARHADWTALPPARMRVFSQWMLDKLGRPYDKAEILEIAVRITAGVLGIPPREVVPNLANICSEYVEEFYRWVGLTIPYDPRGFVAPKDFAEHPAIHFVCEIATTAATLPDTRPVKGETDVPTPSRA